MSKRPKHLHASPRYITRASDSPTASTPIYAAAQDAVQDAMLVVVKKFDQFQEGTSMLAWCRAIVRLEVLRMKQQHQRERSLTERLLDDAIDAAFAEFQAAQRGEAVQDWHEALERCLRRIADREPGWPHRWATKPIPDATTASLST